MNTRVSVDVTSRLAQWLLLLLLQCIDKLTVYNWKNYDILYTHIHIQ